MSNALLTAPVEPSATEFADAFHAVAPELLALARTQLVAMRVDPAAAVATVRGALRRVAPLASRIAAMPEVDHAALAKLPLYTGAFWYAHCQCLAATSPGPSLPELERTCAKHVVRLKSHVTTLANEEVLPAALGRALDELDTPRGYKDNALAVSLLVGVLRERWPSLAGHTSLTLAGLDAMALDATRLLDGAGGPAGDDDPVRAAMIMRQRAFTPFSVTYDQLRRAVSFLRWDEDDLSDFAPALYAHGGGKGRGKPAGATDPAGG